MMCLRYVSIPNGMEFYTISKILRAFDMNCFNSQRDGILRTSALNGRIRQMKFQFPTGWNSTRSLDLGFP